MERYTEYHCRIAVIKDKNKHKEAMEILAAYEDTDLTQEQVQEFADATSRIKAIFADTITAPEIIQFFLDFYEAQNNESRVEDAVLLTNEEAVKWRELKERDMSKEPYYEGDGYDNEGEMVYDTWICPNCDACYEVDYDDYDFCPNCGQRLKCEK